MTTLYNPLLSVFPSATDPDTVADLPLSGIIDRIRGEEFAAVSVRIATAYAVAGGGVAGKETVAAMKRTLPGATLAGTFDRRANAAWREASGLVQFDLDNLDAETLAKARSALLDCPWVACLWVSVSGAGLKGAVLVEGLPSVHDRYLSAWRAVSRWLASLGLVNDPSAKDPARLAFLSHDPQAWHNPGAVGFDLDAWAETEPTVMPRQAAALSAPSDAQVEQRAMAYVRAMPASIQGSNGSADLMAVVRAVHDGFDLSGAGLWRVLDAWNGERADPPWSAAELGHAVASVEGVPPMRAPGWLRDSDRAVTAGPGSGPASWPVPTALPSSVVPSPPDLGVMIPDCLRPMAQYITAVSEALQAPPESALALAVAVAAFAGGRAWEVQTAADHCETLAMWVVALDLPGTKKTGLLHTLAKPLHAWVTDEHRALAEPLAIYREQREGMRARLSALRAALSKPQQKLDPLTLRQEADALVLELERTPDLHPPAPLVTEGTSEGIRDALERNGEKCLLLASEGDALDVLMGRYSKDGKPSLGLVCSAWSGEPMAISRVGKMVHLERPLLGAALYVQPEGAAGFLGSGQARGRGAVDRPWLIAARTRRGERDVDPAPVPADLTAWWSARVRRLMDRPWAGRTCLAADGVVRSQAQPVVLTLAPEARTLWMDWRRAMEPRVRPEVGDLTSCAGFADKLSCGGIPRLAAVFTILADPDAVAVDGECMAAALAWGEWLLDHHRAVMGDLASPPAMRVARRLLASLKRMPAESLTGREAMRRLGGGSSPDAPDMDAVLAACRELEERGWLQPAPSPATGTRGRPTAERWLVYPDLAMGEWAA